MTSRNNQRKDVEWQPEELQIPLHEYYHELERLWREKEKNEKQEKKDTIIIIQM
jgi:hypothetical protein